MSSKIKIIILLTGAVGLLVSHGFLYIKGRSDGRKLTEAKVITKVVTVREKQNEILISRPDADITVRRLRSGSF